MTLSARLWADNGDLAAAALAHPFVSRLGDGSLPREIFAGYVAQDAFFLESFARAYALALARSTDTPTLLALADLLGGVRDTEVDLTSFAALTTQVDAPAMSDMLNHAITTRPVSLPEAVAMLDTAYLGHVIVLWSWALKQPNPEAIESTTVRFRSLDGRDREIPVPV